MDDFLHLDTSYFLKGSFWLTLGFIISTISSLALGLVFANYLPKIVYGQYNYLLTLFSLISLTALPGVNTAIVQSVAAGYEGSIFPAFKVQLRWSLVGTALSILGAIIYFFFFHNSTIALSFLLVAIFTPLSRPLSIYSAILQGKKNFRLSTLSFSVTQIVTTVLLIGIAILAPNVLLLFTVYCLAGIILDLYFIYQTYKSTTWNKRLDKTVISYGKHLTAVNILSTIAGSIDRILIFNLLGPVSLAVYSLAITPPEQIKALLGIGDALALPRLSEQDPAEIRHQMPYHILKIFFICSAIVLAYIVTAPLIYRLLFPKYLGSVLYSQIFSLSLISICFFPASTYLQAKKKVWEQYQSNLFYTIVQIFLMFLLWWHWQLLGVILARTITRFATGFYNVYLFYRSDN